MIPILKYGQVQKDDIFARTEPTMNVEAIVSDIIAQVRAKGDAALYAYCEKFDGVKLNALQVSQEEIDEAFTLVEPRFIEVLTKAAENIRTFHERLQTSGSGVFRYFDQSNKYYLLKDGKVYPIARNKDFAKVYKGDKKAIKGFIRQNRMKFMEMEDKDPAFVEIMAFADKK